MGTAENNAGTKPLGFIENARLTTAFVGAVLDTLANSLAVVWCGKVCRSRDMWLNQSIRAFEPFPDHPYGLWIEIVHFRSGETIGAHTLGLSQFIGREIEFDVDGLEKRTITVRVAELSSYLIANGLDAGIKNYGVFEADSDIDHRVIVLYRDSRLNIGPVISFSSLEDRAGRIKTYEIIPSAIARNHPLLIMLVKARLFDPARIENQIRLKPDHFVSEVRLEHFDNSISNVLSGMMATDAYAEADTKARRALANGDVASASALLRPWATEVGLLQEALKVGLTLCDVFMFMPAVPRSA